MKFKMTKEAAQAMVAIGAGLGLGAIIRYAELKAQLAYEKAERLEKDVEYLYNKTNDMIADIGKLEVEKADKNRKDIEEDDIYKMGK